MDARTHDCVFCEIATRHVAASIVHQDESTLAFVDLRQFHPGHVLVIPRHYFQDVRELDFR
jgi:histidine triad (HIT) family protein